MASGLAAALCGGLVPAAAAAAGPDRAQAAIADQFRRQGLAPAGTRGYAQPVKFIEQQVAAERSAIDLLGGDAPQALAIGRDLRLDGQGPQPERVDAPLVFVGYGAQIAQADPDLRGKLVVVMGGGPAGSSSAEMRRAAERSGALGVITLLYAKPAEDAWDSQAAPPPRLYLAEHGLRETGPALFTAEVNPAAAEKLFARSGRSFAEVAALAAAGRPIGRFALNLSLRARLAVKTRTRASANVLALLPGSDPMLSRQYVVVSAHVGADGAGDGGVASVLELARAMTAGGVRPQRSVLFAVFPAENEGALGQRAFVARPPAPKDALVANLDIVIAPMSGPGSRLIIEGADESSLGGQARAVAAAAGYAMAAAPYREGDALVRTGAPGLALRFGPTAPAGDFVQALLLRITNQDAQPAWAPGSRFAPPAPRAEQSLTLPIDLPNGRRPQATLPALG